MGMFEGIVKGVSDAARVPLSAASDVVEAPKRLVRDPDRLGERTRENIDDLADDAEETFGG